jgi:hypothetical protein
MKISNGFFVAVVVVLVGIVSYQMGKRAHVPTNAEQIEEQVKNDLVALTKKDFEEYQNLKSLEERYKKADEILGKIVTVFLAELGLKLSFKPINPAMIEGSCAIPLTAATPLAAATPSTMSSEPAPTPEQTPLAPKTSSNEWVKMERQLRTIHDEEKALEELRNMQIPDFFGALTEAKNVESADDLEMNGTYVGDITFFDKKAFPSDWNIRMRIQFRSTDTAQNNSYITLSKKSDNKTFSTSRSNRDGIVKQNFSRPGGSQALIVNVYGDDGYVQIYPLGGNRRTWVGN